MRCCPASLRRAKPLLGTFVEITASAIASTDSLRAATDAAFGAIREIHGLMSFHEAGSDVSRLNREAAARPVAVNARTFAVLACAERISRASAGVFDVTVAPGLVDWGRLPVPRHCPMPDPDATFEAIELLEDCHVRFRVPLWIDLGGLAKGYAVDAACAILRDHGVRDFVVNAGGDLAVGAVPTPVHVRDPTEPAAVRLLGRFAETAVATSGAYFPGREGGGRGGHAIVDPARGAPAREAGSISVIAPSAMTADALTKVATLAGEASAPLFGQFAARVIAIPAVAAAATPAGRAE